MGAPCGRAGISSGRRLGSGCGLRALAGHVADVPHHGWRESVRRLQPDVLYGLLDWQAVPFVHEVLRADLGIPFVWHFKEGPFFAREQGSWPQLVDLHLRSDAQVYSSPELRDWFHAVVPGTRSGRSLVIDGDLPKAESFAGGERKPLLSDQDGELHTVIPGRPLGPPPALLGELAALGVHVHLYSGKAAAQMRTWAEQVERLAPAACTCTPRSTLPVGSRSSPSTTPAGCTTSGAPTTATCVRPPGTTSTTRPGSAPRQRPACRCCTATTPAHAWRCRACCASATWASPTPVPRTSPPGCASKAGMSALRESVWRQRNAFTFDAHVDELVALFRSLLP